jgi:hypothetical protein
LRKRKHRTITETTNAIMHDTIYVQNKSLHQTLENITPKENFTRVKPEIEHFRIFACPMYFHVPKEKKSKLDTSGRNDTFLG